MTFGILTLGLGWGSPGGGDPPEPSAPSINSLSISPAGGEVGTLFAAVLSWDGYPRTGVTYQWQDGGVDIEGETGSTYLSDTAIEALTVEVDIDNGEGTDSAESAAVEVTAVVSSDALLLTEGGDEILLTEGGDALLLSEAA